MCHLRDQFFFASLILVHVSSYCLKTFILTAGKSIMICIVLVNQNAGLVSVSDWINFSDWKQPVKHL